MTVNDATARERGAACQSDAARWPMWQAVTTDLVYIRLHGHTRTYESGYSRAALENWARRVLAWRDEGRHVHTAHGRAPRDARRFLELVRAPDRRGRRAA
jgi:uncharacterized protein YecE (DUF72 family)